MAEYRYKKTDWKVHREGNQLYIRESVVRKPKFEANPEIDQVHTRQRELNRQRRRNKEYAQAMNRRYIAFLMCSALLVFASVAVYLMQLSNASVNKKAIQALETQVNDMRHENDEWEVRMESGVNPEAIRKSAIEDLGMVYAGQEQIVNYDYEESDYVRQYEEIPTN